MLDRTLLVTCVKHGDRVAWSVRMTVDGETITHHGSAERMRDARRDAGEMARLMVVSDLSVKVEEVKENAAPALSILPGDA